MCCSGKQVCNSSDTTGWIPVIASTIQGSSLTISLTVVDPCISKPIDGLRYLWKETPCLFKEAAIYNSEDSNLPAPPYIHYF